MKPLVLNKDNNYSLNNVDNFKKDLEEDIREISKKYSELVIEYLRFSNENIKIKNTNLYKYIIIRGLDTITNVFSFILYYTKNIDITFYHCQKSFYFYIEFIEQISEEEKVFLQLSSRDACTYVYKKTIFDINNECKKISENISVDTREKISILDKYISIYRTILYKVIYKTDTDIFKKTMCDFEMFANKLNNIKINIKNINLLDIFIDNLDKKVEDASYFFEIILQFVKKISKGTENIKKCDNKVLSDEFDVYLKNNSSDKLVNWLLS